MFDTNVTSVLLYWTQLCVVTTDKDIDKLDWNIMNWDTLARQDL